MTPIGTKLATLFTGKLIGRDEFGNRYYEQKSGKRHGNHAKRWVIYNGVAEPSKVPPHWHGWLHYTLDAPIAHPRRFAWQKEHLPNLTGTVLRYLPPGHVLKGGHRARATADYKPWKPE
jgi:NADH:ubiquinone oxidoreductase subunit